MAPKRRRNRAFYQATIERDRTGRYRDRERSQMARIVERLVADHSAACGRRWLPNDRAARIIFGGASGLQVAKSDHSRCITMSVIVLERCP
jgi:hypothetical protein